MAILKLQNEGDTHTMTIKECKVVAGNYGEQALFSDGSDSLYLPKLSADRQLERIGLDYDSAVGMNLTFSRDPNPKKGAKPYWSINYAGTEPQESKPTKRVEPTPAAPSTAANPVARREAIVAQYLMLWDTIAGHFQVVCDNRNITLDASAIQSAAATLWISWKDKGIQPDGIPQSVEPPPVVKMPAPSGKRIAPPSKDAPPDFSKFPPPTDDDLPF